MKVGYLNQPWDYGAPPDPGGSMGRWVWEVSRRLARSCEVVVFGSAGANQEATERWTGVQFIQVPLKADERLLKVMQRVWRLRTPRRREIASSLYYRFYAIRAASAFRAQACDVVHIQNFSQFAPLVRRINPRAKIVLHMHSNWLVQLDRGLLERRLDDVDAIVGNSDYVTNAVRKRFPNRAPRCDTVFNGVDIDAFCPSVDGAFCSKRAPIVYVGRLSPEKGVHVLLDAFEKVLTARPCTDLQLIGGPYVAPVDIIVNIENDPMVKRLSRFYGDQNYTEFLQRRLRTGLDSKVTCVGAMRHEELINYLGRGALLVAPSLYETFGMPIVEAMAAALPVVASRVGGLPELVVDKETGLLVTPDEPAALAEAMLRILDDRASAQSMGKAGRLRAEQLFAWDKTVAKLQSLYAAL
jgi:glycosyltransferase involved in cell wall biosynthesis